MTKDSFDYIPLFILTAYTVILLWTVSTTNIIFLYEHYFGVALLAVTFGFFVWRHKLGVLSLGLTLIFGLFKVVSYSVLIDYYSIGGSLNGHSSGNIKIQVIFFLWLLIHFIVSGRHYVGILTKKYWQTLFDKPNNKQVDENHYRQ